MGENMKRKKGRERGGEKNNVVCERRENCKSATVETKKSLECMARECGQVLAKQAKSKAMKCKSQFEIEEGGRRRIRLISSVRVTRCA